MKKSVGLGGTQENPKIEAAVESEVSNSTEPRYSAATSAGLGKLAALANGANCLDGNQSHVCWL